MKYSKTIEVEAYSFKEFVQYGIDSGAELIDGVPWSFDFYGVPVTHENDQLYLTGNLEFTPEKMIVLDKVNKGECFYPFTLWNKEAFLNEYHLSLSQLQKKIRKDMDSLHGKKKENT